MSAREESSALRDEMAELGDMLGQTIKQIAGPQELRKVESIRRLSRDHRAGDGAADDDLDSLIATLNPESLRVVTRAFNVFLDLANLAEDRQRVRVLHQREFEAFPNACAESVAAALQQLKQAGKTPEEIQTLLDQLHIELVFTAHPTEAKRRSIRAKLREIRNLLYASDKETLPKEAAINRRLIGAELEKLWLTDFIRPWRPTVLQEVQRGLSIKQILWDVIPQMLTDIREALGDAYPGHRFRVHPCITLGSWIGGDRDGHPYVTAEVTEQTLAWLRHAALDFHLDTCRKLSESLSLSKRQIAIGAELEEQIDAASWKSRSLEEVLREIPPNEVVRRWLAVVRYRLEQTRLLELDDAIKQGAYRSPAELERDVALLLEAVGTDEEGLLFTGEMSTWLDQIRIFGFHLARLDVRQDSQQYAGVIDELFEKMGVCQDAGELSEEERQRLLLETMELPRDVGSDDLSEISRDTLLLFRLLQRTAITFGLQALGGHVISMTNSPSDVLTVLWFWRHVNRRDAGESAAGILPLPIIPLFETIDDLRNAPQILEPLLRMPAYREYLRSQDEKQIVMLGYSDSTKDGGYLSACWSLHQAQRELHELATREGVSLTFFHGRGGSLGRGGGPAARGILSLPRKTFHGSLRLTEQGEVLADRYDDPRIAHRHLEQLLWSSLLASGMPDTEVPTQWPEIMQRLSNRSFDAYRDLVERPGFVEFFRRATPIAEIEQLPIGSRPARRRGGNSLSDLRAIPWVFSWVQSRCLLPAWYGLGTAAQDSLREDAADSLLKEMYRKWPFFRAAIDNTELALAKTDIGIAERYALLTEESETLTQIGTMISKEFNRSKQAVLTITESQGLLDRTPWLKESIRVRNRYIDPLNLIQIELLRRLQRDDTEDDAAREELHQLARLTIKGIVSGMRTSG